MPAVEDSPGSAGDAQPSISERVMRFLRKHNLEPKASQGDSELRPDTPQQLQVGHAGCSVWPPDQHQLVPVVLLVWLAEGGMLQQFWDVGRRCGGWCSESAWMLSTELHLGCSSERSPICGAQPSDLVAVLQGASRDRHVGALIGAGL